MPKDGLVSRCGGGAPRPPSGPGAAPQIPWRARRPPPRGQRPRRPQPARSGWRRRLRRRQQRPPGAHWAVLAPHPTTRAATPSGRRRQWHASEEGRRGAGRRVSAARGGSSSGEHAHPFVSAGAAPIGAAATGWSGTSRRRLTRQEGGRDGPERTWDRAPQRQRQRRRRRGRWRHRWRRRPRGSGGRGSSKGGEAVGGAMVGGRHGGGWGGGGGRAAAGVAAAAADSLGRDGRGGPPHRVGGVCVDQGGSWMRSTVGVPPLANGWPALGCGRAATAQHPEPRGHAVETPFVISSSSQPPPCLGTFTPHAACRPLPHRHEPRLLSCPPPLTDSPLSPVDRAARVVHPFRRWACAALVSSTVVAAAWRLPSPRRRRR